MTRQVQYVEGDKALLNGKLDAARLVPLVRVCQVYIYHLIEQVRKMEKEV